MRSVSREVDWMTERLLGPLGLGRPDLRAWALYDWANSAFQTTIVGAVFPIYYQSVVAAELGRAAATSRFAYATTIAILIVAIIAPVLGAMADAAPLKKRLLGVFVAIGVTSTAAMYWIGRGDWVFALTLFVLGNIGVASANVFYDSLLPHVARPAEIHRVSSAGYAMGYVGGGLMLAVNALMIQQPALFGLSDGGMAVRVSFVSVAAWWAIFSIPLFLQVAEPALGVEADGAPAMTLFRNGTGRIVHTFRELRRYKQALVLLVAFLLYNDGIQTIMRMGAIYGADIGIRQESLITALLITQFVGIPSAFFFGHLADRIGARPALFCGLGVYASITVLAYFMTSALHFFAIAFLVGTVQGGAQALTRSLFASMIPRDKSSEFFGFFGVFERYAGVLGPLIFAIVVDATGGSRDAALALLLFFISGAAVLARVDVDAGRLAAQHAEVGT